MITAVRSQVTAYAEARCCASRPRCAIARDMPHKALVPCAHPGCPTLVASRTCPPHTIAASRIYRATRPPDAFYRTSQWRKLRQVMLEYAPYCICGAPATEVDHITPIRQGGAPLDERNLQTMCKGCHSRKTRAERRGGFGQQRWQWQ